MLKNSRGRRGREEVGEGDEVAGGGGESGEGGLLRLEEEAQVLPTP